MKTTLFKSGSCIKRYILALLPYLRQRRTLVTLLIGLVVLLIAASLTFMKQKPNNFLIYHQNVEILPYTDGLHVAVNDGLLDHLIQAEKCQKLSSSIDGTVSVFLTDNKELYLVHKRTLKKIADDVLHFEISASGYGVAFAQKYAKQNALTLYDLKEETRREITTMLTRFDFSLSPDGQTVAYYAQQDQKEVLMCYRNGQSSVISTEKADLVGLSDDGKYIYAVCPKFTNSTALYSFDHNGRATELGLVTSISFKFNHNHQQIMFYNNGSTLVSINGQPAVVVASYPLYLVTAPNSQSSSDGNAITLPVTTLFNHIYTCSDGEATSAWLIRKNPEENEKLVSHVSGCILDASSEYLYFIHDQSKLCVMNITNGLSKIHTLAEHADTYVVTSDRRVVYYTYQGTLYSTNGKKEDRSQIIAEEISVYNLAIGASDALYYLRDSSVYICRGAKKAEHITQNIKSIYSSSNNVVYIIGVDEIYTAYTKKYPFKILGRMTVSPTEVSL